MRPRWHILGVGAIGGLFARWLTAGGADVRLLSHRDHEPLRTLTFADVQCQADIQLINENPDLAEPIRLLLVCTKSHAVTAALQSFRSRIDTQTTIALLCNGMGIAEQVRKHYPSHPLWVGTTTAACYRDEAGLWHPVDPGTTALGPADPPTIETGTAPALAPWQAGVPDFRWRCDIETALLEKLVINAVINPATALLDIRNGELLSTTHRGLTQQACEEVAAVLGAAGRSSLATSVTEKVASVAQATAGNVSSMCADVRAGRRTEIESILGYLLEVLTTPTGTIAASQINTPLLDEWLARLRFHDAQAG